MASNTKIQQQAPPEFLGKWGFWAVIMGAAALMLVFVQIVGPSFEAKPSVGTQIGEIAGEIKRAAWRSFFGLPNEAPEAASVSLWHYLAVVGPALGIVAIVLSMISGIKRENWRYSVYGTSLGAAAVLFHFFWWLALLVVGMVLLVTIIANIGEIFSLS